MPTPPIDAIRDEPDHQRFIDLYATPESIEEMQVAEPEGFQGTGGTFNEDQQRLQEMVEARGDSTRIRQREFDLVYDVATHQATLDNPDLTPTLEVAQRLPEIEEIVENTWQETQHVQAVANAIVAFFDEGGEARQAIRGAPSLDTVQGSRPPTSAGGNPFAEPDDSPSMFIPANMPEAEAEEIRGQNRERMDQAVTDRIANRSYPFEPEVDTESRLTNRDAIANTVFNRVIDDIEITDEELQEATAIIPINGIDFIAQALEDRLEEDARHFEPEQIDRVKQFIRYLREVVEPQGEDDQSRNDSDNPFLAGMDQLGESFQANPFA